MKNRIERFMHCRKCLVELPEGQSPQDYARLAVGFTNNGVQVWCNRHDEEVVHLTLLDSVEPT